MKTGTVSHGTLLTYDLIEAFVTELEDVSVATNGPEHRERIKRLIAEANDICALGCRDGKDAVNYPASEDAADYFAWVLERLFDELGEFAPDGYYFGAHEGDGSDFGYWPTGERTVHNPGCYHVDCDEDDNEVHGCFYGTCGECGGTP